MYNCTAVRGFLVLTLLVSQVSWTSKAIPGICLPLFCVLSSLVGSLSYHNSTDKDTHQENQNGCRPSQSFHSHHQLLHGQELCIGDLWVMGATSQVVYCGYPAFRGLKEE